MKTIKLKAFTLAEVMTTLIIIGTVAAITIPTAITRHIKTTNKVKVQKAMADYQKAIQMMSVDNNLRNRERLSTWANPNQCTNSSRYFVTIQRQGCVFQTKDRLWWDISDINNPIIAFEHASLRANIAEADDNILAFRMSNLFDKTTKTFKINDIDYAESSNNFSDYLYLKKIYKYTTEKDLGSTAVTRLTNQLSNIALRAGESKIFVADGKTYRLSNTSGGAQNITMKRENNITYLTGDGYTLDDLNEGDDNLYLKGNNFTYNGGDGDKTIVFGGDNISINVGDGDFSICPEDVYLKGQCQFW